MKKRVTLRQRLLPDYTKGEEIMNMVTHIVGGALGLAILLLFPLRAYRHGSTAGVITSLIYALSMIALYTVSSVYHGLRPGMGKKVLQVLDHCTIYLLIAGTYTPIMVAGFYPVYPALATGMVVFQWGLTALAVTLTAIDLERTNVFSMICYIGLGWAILPFMGKAMVVMTAPGFYWLLAGGIAYTIGAVLYGIGSKVRWIHSVFHIFVVLGSVLQAVAIYGFVL